MTTSAQSCNNREMQRKWWDKSETHQSVPMLRGGGLFSTSQHFLTILNKKPYSKKSLKTSENLWKSLSTVRAVAPLSVTPLPLYDYGAWNVVLFCGFGLFQVPLRSLWLWENTTLLKHLRLQVLAGTTILMRTHVPSVAITKLAVDWVLSLQDLKLQASECTLDTEWWTTGWEDPSVLPCTFSHLRLKLKSYEPSDSQSLQQEQVYKSLLNLWSAQCY